MDLDEARNFITLQWGRDHLIAEMHYAALGRRENYTLQWGRDHLIAEMKRLNLGLFVVDKASMGPRSSDRGNTAESGNGGFYKRLQWGRDHLIAEIAAAPAWLLDLLRASMGPRSSDRGNKYRG